MTRFHTHWQVRARIDCLSNMVRPKVMHALTIFDKQIAPLSDDPNSKVHGFESRPVLYWMGAMISHPLTSLTCKSSIVRRK